MKKLLVIGTMIISLSSIVFLTGSCSSQRELAAQKSGAQLWADNCLRCHNLPSPAAYNDVEWETIGLHMKERANMTTEQIEKIVSFIQTAN